MLVLARQREETITLGGPNSVVVDLSPNDREALQKCSDPALQDLAARLVAATPGALEVTVVDIRGDKVRLGIAAPKAVAIHREEIYLQLLKEQGERAKGRDTYVPTVGSRRT